MSGVIVFFLVLSLLSVYSEDEYIEWNPFYQLHWNDFRGEPAPGAAGDAGAVVKIQAKPYRVKNEVFYDVKALFNRDRSWVRDGSDLLLEHERLHFDLAELYARKVRQRIEQLKHNRVKDIGVFNAEIRKLLDESNDVDIRYDVETLHGAMSRRQKEWNLYVHSELKVLEPFARKRKVVGG